MKDQKVRKWPHIPCRCEVRTDNSTVETLAVTPGAKTWKSRVSAIIHHARSSLRF